MGGSSGGGKRLADPGAGEEEDEGERGWIGWRRLAEGGAGQAAMRWRPGFSRCRRCGRKLRRAADAEVRGADSVSVLLSVER
jgi:hypothetical protein